MDSWHHCSHLLVVRPDNIGDVLMSSPAIRALKRSFGCKITLLTSEAGAMAAALLPEVDETLVANFPWAKHVSSISPAYLNGLISRLRTAAFDGCVVFSVYSQNPLPTVMLAWEAGIPRRLAYCRENPYELLTHWVPDAEPYSHIRHQVVRDLDLVEHIGAYANDDRITLTISSSAEIQAMEKLRGLGVDVARPFVIFHAGVSEPKRAFPLERWIALARRFLATHPSQQVLFTGNAVDRPLTDRLCAACGTGAFSVGGLLSITEFAAVIRQAALVVSVNTATIHLASALGRPLVVLYALTNPQHTPWRCPHILFPYSVPEEGLQSRNEVIRYVNGSLYPEKVNFPATNDILDAVEGLLNRQGQAQLV